MLNKSKQCSTKYWQRKRSVNSPIQKSSLQCSLKFTQVSFQNALHKQSNFTKVLSCQYFALCGNVSYLVFFYRKHNRIELEINERLRNERNEWQENYATLSQEL